ncbi:MAG: hypothetical protein IPP71_15995 [Bacteroidetes bacterium]|nr:hypothetical protein [Bacteroidota bacterium]
MSIVDLLKNEVKNIPNPFTCYVTSAVISPNNRLILVTAGFDGNMGKQAYGEFLELDILTGQGLYNAKKINGMLWNAAYSPDGSEYMVALPFYSQIFESPKGLYEKDNLEYCIEKKGIAR